MAKNIKILFISTATVLFIALATIIFSILFLYNSNINIDIIKTEVSPNGDYTAYLFECNSGATSDFIYNLSVLKTGRELKSSTGNTYRSHDKFDFYWEDDNTLTVEIKRFDEIIMQKNEINKVTINYKEE